MSPAAIGAAAALVVAVAAALADRRRVRRDDPDAVGWIDWRTVQMFALVSAMLCVGLAFSA